MTYRNFWFDGRHSRRQLPIECVCDCAGQGRRDEPVDAWVRRLEFDGPAWLIREHLRGYGAWGRSELCDHQQNLRRLLWIWASNAWEDPDHSSYLYLGV
jgi:hypothetical protein